MKSDLIVKAIAPVLREELAKRDARLVKLEKAISLLTKALEKRK